MQDCLTGELKQECCSTTPAVKLSVEKLTWGEGTCSEETKCGQDCKFKFSVYHLEIGLAWLAATFYCKVVVGLIIATLTEHCSDRLRYAANRGEQWWKHFGINRKNGDGGKMCDNMRTAELLDS